jgi:hypothetical protein
VVPRRGSFVEVSLSVVPVLEGPGLLPCDLEVIPAVRVWMSLIGESFPALRLVGAASCEVRLLTFLWVGMSDIPAVEVVWAP